MDSRQTITVEKNSVEIAMFALSELIGTMAKVFYNDDGTIKKYRMAYDDLFDAVNGTKRISN